MTRRCVLTRRMGEGALALRVCVWAPCPVALELMPLAKRASVRKGCKGSGVGDNIRVFTGRGLEINCGLKVAGFIFSQKTLVLSRAPCPGSSFCVCSAALCCGLPVHGGKGPAALKVRCITFSNFVFDLTTTI